jgi:carbon starvation protein CstA
MAVISLIELHRRTGDFMGSLSPLHLMILLVIPAALLGCPVAKILQRLGMSRWWTIVVFVPLCNLMGLWALAFVRWPKLDQQSAKFGETFN